MLNFNQFKQGKGFHKYSEVHSFNAKLPKGSKGISPINDINTLKESSRIMKQTPSTSPKERTIYKNMFEPGEEKQVEDHPILSGRQRDLDLREARLKFQQAKLRKMEDTPRLKALQKQTEAEALQRFKRRSAFYGREEMQLSEYSAQQKALQEQIAKQEKENLESAKVPIIKNGIITGYKYEAKSLSPKGVEKLQKLQEQEESLGKKIKTIRDKEAEKELKISKKILRHERTDRYIKKPARVIGSAIGGAVGASKWAGKQAVQKAYAMGQAATLWTSKLPTEEEARNKPGAEDTLW